MKTIRINGEEKSISEAIVSYEDFIKNMSRALTSDTEVISCVKIDGQEITEETEKSLKTTSINDLGDIEIFTSNPIELANETLNTLDLYLDRLRQTIEKAAINYKGKNLMGGDHFLAKAIDGIDLFVQTISGVKLALRMGLNQKVALAEATLVSIMNDLLEAKRQNNYVFLAELLEKDLIENLTEWQTEVFKIFRNWKVA